MLNLTNKDEPLFTFQSRKRLNQVRWCVSIVVGSFLFACARTEEPYFVAFLVGILSVFTFYFGTYLIFRKKHVRIKDEEQQQ